MPLSSPLLVETAKILKNRKKEICRKNLENFKSKISYTQSQPMTSNLHSSYTNHQDYSA